MGPKISECMVTCITSILISHDGLLLRKIYSFMGPFGGRLMDRFREGSIIQWKMSNTSLWPTMDCFRDHIVEIYSNKSTQTSPIHT